MSVVKLVLRFGRDREGAAALEFGLLLPVFAMLVLGVIQIGQMANAMSSMNFAVQEAARCSAVNQTTCGTAGSTVTYAKAKYLGPKINPAFVSNTTGCGHTVSATANYKVDLAFLSYTMPLKAAACFP